MEKYTKEKIQAALKELKDKWVLDPGGNSISITYSGTFASLMLFANAVAHVADKVNHHPCMLIDYDKIRFTLTSRDAGGFSEFDFKLTSDPARHLERFAPQGKVPTLKPDVQLIFRA